MRFSDACSSSCSPPVVAFVAPGSAPPPCPLPHHPHTSTGAFTRPLAYPEVSSTSSFSVQRLTSQRSCSGSPRPYDDSRSDSPRYVRHPDTACASLKPVVQSTVHARRRPALQHPGASPLLAAFLAAPTLPCAHSKAFGITRGEYHMVVRSPTAYNSRIMPRLAQVV